MYLSAGCSFSFQAFDLLQPFVYMRSMMHISRFIPVSSYCPSGQRLYFHVRLFEARAFRKKSHLPVHEYLSSKLLVVEQIVWKFMCPFTLLKFHNIFLFTSSVVGYLLVLQTCRLKDQNTKQGFVFKSAGAMTPHPDKVHIYLL